MKRTTLCGLMAAFALTWAALPGRASAARMVPVQVDGTVLPTVNYLTDGVTYVPLRSLMEAFGGWEVYWDSEKKVAVAQSSDLRLTANPAGDTITAGNRTYTGEVFIERGRTYVPVRLVADLCGGSAGTGISAVPPSPPRTQSTTRRTCTGSAASSAPKARVKPWRDRSPWATWS